MSSEMINFLTTKFRTSLDEVEKGGGRTGFPLKKIFQDISLALERIKVSSSSSSSSIPIPTRDTLLSCLYTINDAFTECRLLFETRCRRRFLSYYTPKEWYQLGRIKEQLLKTLKHDLHSVTNEHLQTSSSTVGRITTGFSESFEFEGIYGFDEREKEIVTSLCEKLVTSVDKFTIGIVGMNGSGKTALCELVCNHPHVKWGFFPRVWVGLPNRFENGTDVTKSIAEYILEELGTGDGTHNASVDELLVTLHRRLSGWKYLIVFDNVWDLNSWYDKIVNMNEMRTQEGIPLGLPNGDGGGIIITSRLEEDVKHMVGEANLYSPPMLNEEDSWRVFLDEMKHDYFNPCRPEVYSMKTKIVENINGLPSAAKTLASIFGHIFPRIKKRT